MKKELIYLVATSGDMSNTGMGDTTTVIPFDIMLLPQVSKFLKAQLDDELSCYMYYSPNKKLVSRKSKMQKTNKFYDQCKVMRDLGIFLHKYDARTTWALMLDLEVVNELPNTDIRLPVAISEVA